MPKGENFQFELEDGQFGNESNVEGSESRKCTLDFTISSGHYICA
jgi:hypothetical protein